MIDYLECAKHSVDKVSKSRSSEYNITFALVAIANALIAIAERMASK